MKKNLIAAVLMMVVSMGAMAVEQGTYWGANLGYAPASGTDVSGAGGRAGITNASGFGLGALLGYSINKYAAVESSYNAIMGWKSGLTEVAADTLSASVIGFYPIPVPFDSPVSGLDLYGKLGYSNSTVSYSGCTGCKTSSASKSALSYGFGVEFGGADKSVRMRLGVDHYDLSAFAGASLSTNYYNGAVIFNF